MSSRNRAAYELVRSRRGTLALAVTADGRLQVRAPLRLPAAVIDRFVEEKADWIAARRAEMAEREAKRAAFVLRPGSAIPCRGREIRLASGEAEGFEEDTLTLPDTVWRQGESAVRTALAGWYRQRAERELLAVVERCAALTGWRPTGIRITGARTRWGSCSGRNSVNFSWRLLMAPEEAIEYVVVHELAHTVEHNHSPRFWSLVEGILPDWKGRRQRLRELERRLAEENW